MSTGVTQSVRLAAEYDQLLRDVEAKTGASADEMERLEEAARRASEHDLSSSSTAQNMEVALSGATAGMSTDEIIGSMQTVNLLSSATGVEAGETMDIVTNVMNSLGLAGDEVERFGNVMAAGHSSTDATFSDISKSFKNVGGALNQLGLDVEDQTALFGIVAGRGFRKGEAGTKARGIQGDLAKEYGRSNKALKKLGIRTRKEDGVTMRNLFDIMDDLDVALDGKDKNSALIDIFGKERGEFARAIMEDRDAIRAKSEEIRLKAKEGELQRQAATQAKGAEFQFKKLKAELQNTAVGVGLELLPAVLSLTKSLGPAAIKLAEWTKSFTEFVNTTSTKLEELLNRPGEDGDDIRESYGREGQGLVDAANERAQQGLTGSAARADSARQAIRAEIGVQQSFREKGVSSSQLDNAIWTEDYRQSVRNTRAERRSLYRETGNIMDLGSTGDGANPLDAAFNLASMRRGGREPGDILKSIRFADLTDGSFLRALETQKGGTKPAPEGRIKVEVDVRGPGEARVRELDAEGFEIETATGSQ